MLYSPNIKIHVIRQEFKQNMKEIAPDILIENDFIGVTVGVIRTPEGIFMIDYPLLPKELLAWQTVCTRPGSGSKRLVVLLDDHPDRAGGCKGSRSPIITHTYTAQSLRGRPSTTKMHGMETGNIWELAPEIATIEWPQPEITFSDSVTLGGADNPIIVENHPSSTTGALWVTLPERKVVFIGDAITPGQPPFLFSAQIDPWLENLDQLKSAAYKDFTIISGRGTLVTKDDIRNAQRFLRKAARALERLNAQKADLTKVQKTAISYLDDFKAKNKQEKDMFRNRLSYGFSKYYINNFTKNR